MASVNRLSLSVLLTHTHARACCLPLFSFFFLSSFVFPFDSLHANGPGNEEGDSTHMTRQKERRRERGRRTGKKQQSKGEKDGDMGRGNGEKTGKGELEREKQRKGERNE